MSESISGFDPRSIGGCQLWLDATDSSALTGTSPVTAWRDKSPNVSSTTSVAGTNVLTQNAMNGRPAILLNGSSSFTGSTTGSGTTLTVCIVGTQSNTCAVSGGLVCFGRAGFADNTDAGSLAITNSTPLGSGLIVSTRTSVNSQIVNTGGSGLINGSSASPFVYILVNDGTFVNSYLNGTIQTTANISRAGTFAYTNYVIGARAGSTTNVFYTGFIGEVLVYNSGLSTQDREAVEGYLTWKWRIETIPSIPGTISGLAMWLDGADSSTLFTDTSATTLVTADGNSIAAWRDKSTNAYLFTQATLGSRPIYKTSILNGRSITRWNGTSTALQSSATLPFYTSSTSGGSFFVVFMATTVASQRFLMTYQNQTANTYCGSESELGYTTGNGGQGNFGFHQGCSRATVAATGTIVINSYVLMSYILGTTGTTPANSTIFKNGVSLTPANDQTGFYSAGSYPSANNARFLNIGARIFNGTNPTDCWHSGDIAELIWYRTPLSTTERQGVESYLSSKWNISVPTQALPLSHPFASIPPFSRRFQPIDISIPEYWFDAADSNTITTSGTFLTTWLNKGSLTGSNVTPTTANTATSGTTRVNGNNLINIPITQRLQFTGTFPNLARTRFIVTRQTSAGDVVYLYQGGTSINGHDALGIGTNTLFEVAQGQIVNLQTATIPAQTNLMALLTFFNSSVATGSNRIALNGSNVTLTTSIIANQYFAGSITTFLNGTTGPGQDLGEFISFNQNLTLEEIFEIEGYLAWKWGLQSSLPNTHAFKTFPPSIALPFLPRNIPGCALWLDGDDLSTLTLSGTNIIQWNDKSGNNRNAIQLTVANRPVYSFTDKSVDTTTNPRFFNMTSMPSAPYDIFVVGTPIASTASRRTLFRTNTADPGMNPIVLEAASTNLGYFTSAAFAQFGSYTWTGSTRNLLFARMNVSKTMSASLNGVIALTADTVAGTASDVILYMGALVVSGVVSQQWGNINEVIFYTTPLSTAQRQYVEGYLASKWNLTRLLPSIHPYYEFSPSQKSFIIPVTSTSLSPSTLNTITAYLRTFIAEFRNPSFYGYSFDGNAYTINDGGGDMYDGGNWTNPWLLAGTQITGNTSSQLVHTINYAATTATTVDTTFIYASLGYTQGTTGITANHPLTVLGYRTTTGNPVGFQVAGNSGADGGGTLASGILYAGTVLSGFTVHAFYRETYNAGDPSHCNLFILLGHTAWGSVFGTISSFADPVANGGNGAYFFTSGAGVSNILAVQTLLSKSGGVLVTAAECQTVVQAFANRIKLSLGL